MSAKSWGSRLNGWMIRSRRRWQGLVTTLVTTLLRPMLRPPTLKNPRKPPLLRPLRPPGGVDPRSIFDEAVRELAKLDRAGYELVRKEKAKQLGVRPTVLDQYVLPKINLKSKPKEDAPEVVSIPELKPWPEPVIAGELFDEVTDVFKRFVNMDHPELLPLWIAGTHTFDAWWIYPFILVRAPTENSGKTRVLTLVRMMVPKPLHASGFRGAHVFRLIDQYGRLTLLMDEGDTYLDGDEDLRGILNCSHEKASATVPRCVPDADGNYSVQLFPCWGPKAIAKIGDFARTIRTRGMMISLKRAKEGEVADYFPFEHDQMMNDLGRKFARLGQFMTKKLKKAKPEMPRGLYNRHAENWRPLIAIADQVGGKWPKLARELACSYNGINSYEEVSDQIKVLYDIRTILEKRKKKEELGLWIPTKGLIVKLAAMEDRPWTSWKKSTRDDSVCTTTML